MANKFEKIDEALNVESSIVEVDSNYKPTLDTVKELSNDIKKDYEYTRANLYSLIEKGQEAINGIMELAGEGGSPRAYEVAGQLIKNVGDVTDKLLDLQKKMKDINKEEKGSTPTSVTNNAVFFGSTAELQKFLKSSMNQDTSK